MFYLRLITYENVFDSNFDSMYKSFADMLIRSDESFINEDRNMEFRKLYLLFISSLFLMGCGNVTIEIPSDFKGKSLDYSVIEISKDNKGAGRSISVEASMDIKSTGEQRAATAMQVALDIYRKESPALVFVKIRDPLLKNAGTVATANLYAAGCGIGGDECDGEIWNVTYAANTPTPDDIKVYQGWWDNRDRFQTRGGGTNDSELKNFLSKKLNIPAEKIKLFSYEDWNRVDI